MKKKAIVTATMLLAVTFFIYRRYSGSRPVVAAPTATKIDEDASGSVSITMQDVLDLAQDARLSMSTEMKDYTARFVRQEVDSSGNLQPESEIFMKVHSTLRNETDDAPMRVYMRFDSPEDVKGREIVWGEDLYDGNMQVRVDTGFLGIQTVPIDPNGIIAKQSSRYPISEIGLKRLIEQLIKRGTDDKDDPGVTVTMVHDQKLDDVNVDLIQVRRSEPTPDNEENDFSLAEILYDPNRKLILRFRSYGWPDEAASSENLPLPRIVYLPRRQNERRLDR